MCPLAYNGFQLKGSDVPLSCQDLERAAHSKLGCLSLPFSLAESVFLQRVSIPDLSMVKRQAMSCDRQTLRKEAAALSFPLLSGCSH